MGERSDDNVDDNVDRHNRRKAPINQASPLNHDANLHQSQRSLYSGSQSTTPPTAGYSLKAHDPPPPSNPYYGYIGDGSTETSQGREVTNETAAALFQSPINGPGDAFHLLLEASGRSGDINRQLERRVSNQHRSSAGKDLAAPQNFHDGQRQYVGLGPVLQGQPANIDPAIMTGDIPETQATTSDLHEALHTWSRLRFVRAGWLTATEAMSYID